MIVTIYIAYILIAVMNTWYLTRCTTSPAVQGGEG